MNIANAYKLHFWTNFPGNACCSSIWTDSFFVSCSLKMGCWYWCSWQGWTKPSSLVVPMFTMMGRHILISFWLLCNETDYVWWIIIGRHTMGFQIVWDCSFSWIQTGVDKIKKVSHMILLVISSFCCKWGYYPILSTVKRETVIYSCVCNILLWGLPMMFYSMLKNRLQSVALGCY